MESTPAIETLKTKLQSLGALRPEAWQKILQLARQSQLKSNESFIRKEGTLAYIAEGLLKEYDAQYRKSPAIINFISTHNFLITRRYNQIYYLKACIPTHIYYWDFEALKTIYQNFSELKSIYNACCAAYDESIGLRQRLLEEKDANHKIALFVQTNRSLLLLIKKKDIANYLNLGYDYFARNYNKHL